MMDILSFFDRKEYKNCITCGRLIKNNEFSQISGKLGICKNCSSHLPIVPVGMTFEEHSKYIEYCASAFFYRQPVRNLIIDLKFKSCVSYADLLSAYMNIYAGTLFEEENIDLIVPVPLSDKRLKERGYNQAELFSVPLSDALEIQHSSEALIRTRATARQSDLSPWKRTANTENAFRANERIVKNKSILLIDDVYTTGSTVRECAKTLILAGAQKVIVYTLARQPGRRKSKEYNELLSN